MTQQLRYAKLKKMRFFWIGVLFSFLLLPSFAENKQENILKSKAKVYRQRGYKAQTTGDLEGALLYYTKALEFDPYYVEVYNDLNPPTGTYAVWVGIVDKPELTGEPPFTYKSFSTVIKHNGQRSTINPEATPWNWGKITSFKYRLITVLLWAFSGGELVAVMVFWSKDRKLKLKHKL